MKIILFVSTMLLICIKLNAQISDVQVKDRMLYVYGENNKQLSSINLNNFGGAGEYLGMGSSFYVVKSGTMIYTYDQNSKQISSLNLGSIGNGANFKNAAGNSFNIQTSNKIYTYDKDCKRTGERGL